MGKLFYIQHIGWFKYLNTFIMKNFDKALITKFLKECGIDNVKKINDATTSDIISKFADEIWGLLTEVEKVVDDPKKEDTCKKETNTCACKDKCSSPCDGTRDCMNKCMAEKAVTTMNDLDVTTPSKDDYDVVKELMNDQLSYEKTLNSAENAKKEVMYKSPCCYTSPLYDELVSFWEETKNEREEELHEVVYPAILKYAEKQLTLFVTGGDSKCKWHYPYARETMCIAIDTADLEWKIAYNELNGLKKMFQKYLDVKQLEMNDDTMYLEF